MKSALMRLVMTATPLQTSTKVIHSIILQFTITVSIFLKDIAGMGRLLGIPYFLSEEALNAEKSDLSSFRHAKRNSPEEFADQAVRECQVAVAQRLQTHFTGRILRRGVSSLNWLGAFLISLPLCQEIFIQVKPTAREMEIISELADRVKEK
jgi:TATA-binding protein-associated factor